jgi:tRNA(Ile)-lysidine synthase
MTFSLAGLLQRLQGLPPAHRYLVAYSGGRDSHVLLHALAALRGRYPAELGAVHADHGIHPDAAAWAEHCREVCAGLAVPFSLVRLSLDLSPGESREAVARRARYHALATLLGPDDVLLTAHHRDDQAETLLLQLLRGSGPSGLAAMPVLAELPPGHLARPLLGFSRDQLAVYARREGLSWIEDPSNRDSDFDRNFLRNEVFPVLLRRWPGLGKALARSARHCAEAQAMIDHWARADLAGARGGQPGSLSVAALRQLPSPRCRAVLRYWLREQRVRVPDTARLDRILREVLGAGADRMPLVHWDGAEVRRYRDALFLLRPLPHHDPALRLDWDGNTPLGLPAGLGILATRPARGSGIDGERWRGSRRQIGFRLGGERCRPAGGRHTRSLKALFQEHGVVPWMRNRVPLVFLEGRLAAVGDYLVCDEFGAAPGRDGVEICWYRGDRASVRAPIQGGASRRAQP